MAVQEQVYGFFIPSVTLIGIGASKQIPDKIKALGGSKPLLVTDKGVVAAGICKQVTDLLDAAAMPYVIYDETVPNPTDKNIHDGCEVYRKNGCDSLITLGGGSSHDCGKGIGLIISNGGKIHDYEGIDKATKSLMPYLAVNTTAGTASEMTRFAVITDTSRHVKMAIADWRITPGIAIDDPVLMVGMLFGSLGFVLVSLYLLTGHPFSTGPIPEFLPWIFDTAWRWVPFLLLCLGGASWLHSLARKWSGTAVIRLVEKNYPSGPIREGLERAFAKNIAPWRSIFCKEPTGWGQKARKLLVSVIADSEKFIQALNDRYAHPSGVPQPLAQENS